MAEATSETTLEQASLPTTIHVRASAEEDTTTRSHPTNVPASTTGAISLVLDANEHELFQILVKVASAFSAGDVDLEEWQTNPSSRPSSVIIRVAGGWVRDKLIQDYGGAYDVDLAVENMTGVQLATLIQSYVKKYHPEMQASRMGVIAANPAQSKHLETATFKLCGIEMDLSNLRAHEVYTEDSRIPIVRLGTPLEDALRRDFTVNALFYNLHSQQVEDWTGRAVRDLLQEKVLVTPLEPVQTFRDDPLRILRAVRFAVRLDLRMDPALQAAARLPEIRQALGVKVSRERFGKELEGMLSGKQAKPFVALTTIIDLGLASIVFALPRPDIDKKIGGVQGPLLGEEGREEDYVTDNQEQVERVWTESKHLISTTSPLWEGFRAFVKPTHNADGRLLPLAIALSPFRKLQYFEAKKPDRLNSAISYIIRESIKFKKDDVTELTLLTEHVDTMADLLADVDNVARVDAGLLLRTLRDHWPTALLMAALLKSRRDSTVDWIAKTEQLYRKIVYDYDLDQCWKMKPLLDGKVLQQTFGKGPIVGVYMQEQTRWMLTYPNGNAEECLEHLKQAQVRDSGVSGEGPKRKKPHTSS